MALDIGFGLGFLVGSLALLAFVLYMTRIRGPTLPHETMIEGKGGTAEGERDDPGTYARTDPTTPTMDACEICGENPASRSVNDMAVCAECDEELL